MPLREDLLAPIAGDNASGANLYYDKLFDQIKEARTEDDDSGSAGAWERAAKKADHVLVVKLAGEGLATRSKDMRLAGWLVESLIKREGIPVLPSSLELIWKLQETFWDTFYPEIDEDGDLGLRVSAVESIAHRLAPVVRNLPIVKGGYSALQYTASRLLGYEEAADTDEKQAARQDAIDQGRITPEDFDTAFAGTSKASLVALETALTTSLDTLSQMGEFHEGKYGDDYPSLNKLTGAIEEVKQVVSSLLYERRKTDPDEVVQEEPTESEEAYADPFAATDDEPAQEDDSSSSWEEAPARPAAKPARAPVFSGKVATAEHAYASVLQGALFLLTETPDSPVPYLVCAGLRLGETRAQGSSPSYDFPVAPPTETRQTLRRYAQEGNWSELVELGLRTLTEPCGRVWLDLQRYLWRAAAENGHYAIATAVVATTRALLQDIPDLRTWTLDDDTPAANAETQAWIDAEVLPPVAAPEAVEESYTEPEPEPEPEPAFFAEALPAVSGEDNRANELFEEAKSLVQRGRAGEAITLLVRDAEAQPSGRSKFQRRVQVAQLCLMADQAAVAYPVLVELSREIERRGLEAWETGEMLAQPLGLLLRCMEKRKSPSEERELIFERLCRLDPQVAFGLRS